MTLSRWLPALRTGFRALFRRSRLERDLEAEIRFHLDRQIAEHLERGLSPREARRSALAAFGGVEAVKEMSRDQWAFRVVEGAALETRHAVRRLRRRPGFTLGAVLSLGLGLGLTALMLSVASAYRWRPLPVPGRGTSTCRPPSTTGLSALPPRHAVRSTWWRPFGPHRASRSPSIRASRTCSPVAMPSQETLPGPRSPRRAPATAPES